MAGHSTVAGRKKSDELADRAVPGIDRRDCRRCDPGAEESGPAVSRLDRRGMAWVAGSFLLCPCHLPITLSPLGALLGGTAAGVALREHPVAAGLAIAVVWAAGTWRGLVLLRRADPRRPVSEPRPVR